VIAGHTRLKAAIKLGLDQVRVCYLDLTADEAHALALADNKSGELAEWDEAQLAEVLKELEVLEEIDLEGLGFSVEELDELLEVEAPAEPDPPPEPPADPVSVRGEVYELGPHRLMCGDSTSADDVRTLLAGDTPTLGMHDPPYGIDVVARDGGRGAIGDGKKWGNAVAPRGTFAPIIGDTEPFDPKHLLSVSDVVVLWGANHYADKLPSSPAWLVWDKRGDLPSNCFADCEVAWTSTKRPARIIRHRWMGMIRDSERGDARVHPTQKPVELMGAVIKDLTGIGDTVCDLYLGSGTTLIAAARQGRRCYGMEISPAYCDVIRKRWGDYARANTLEPGPGAL